MADGFAERRGSRIKCLQWGEDQKQLMCSENPRKAQKWEFSGSTEERQGALEWEWGCASQQEVKGIPSKTKEGSSVTAALEQREQLASLEWSRGKRAPGGMFLGAGGRGQWNWLKEKKKQRKRSSEFESCLCHQWTVNISKSVNIFGLQFPHLLNKRLEHMMFKIDLLNKWVYNQKPSTKKLYVQMSSVNSTKNLRKNLTHTVRK